METIPEKIRKQLRAPMPPEAIKQHPTKSFLSTIKAIYVTERLNDVFGIGGWTASHEIIEDTPEYVSVRGCITLNEPYNFSTPDQYGGHTKTGKNTEPADGYKSAVTDMMSKCASYLEIGIDVFKGKVKPNRPDIGFKETTFKSKPEPKKKADPPSQPNKPSPKQYKAIFAIGKEKGLSSEEVKQLADWYKIGEHMTAKEASRMIENFDEVVDAYMISPEYAEKGDK